MPSLLKPCLTPGCPRYAEGTAYCTEHRRQFAEGRGTTKQRGYDDRWKRVRILQLHRQPLCEDCFSVGVYRPAKQVHHMLPIATHPRLRLALSNLRSLCTACHAKYSTRVYERKE